MYAYQNITYNNPSMAFDLITPLTSLTNVTDASLMFFGNDNFEYLTNAMIGDFAKNNTDTLKGKMSNLENNISTIKSNREGYCSVLKEAIRIYQDTSKETIASAKKMEGPSYE
jgi:hypothetical protein